MDQGERVPTRLLEGAEGALDRALALARRWSGSKNLRVSLAPRFILSCSERLWRDVTDASREQGLLVHTHLAESPTEGGEVKDAVGSHAAPYFATHGVLSPRFVELRRGWTMSNSSSWVRPARRWSTARART
jgi:cytosine/adenosine deaminase-related metal-dependent hydrolase